MRREFSAGGVVVRAGANGDWEVAAIHPAGKRPGLWALPKGRIDPGEEAQAAAIRESAEETGLASEPLAKLGDVRYWFNFDGERIFKIVSFFLLRATGGELGDVPPEFRHEVDDTRWLPLADAPALLAYSGERDMARKALAALEGGAHV